MILFGFEKWGFWVWLNVLWLNICLRWASVCVVVIALVWIFGFQMNGDFWVSNEWWFLGFKWTVVGWVFALYRLVPVEVGGWEGKGYYYYHHFVCVVFSMSWVFSFALHYAMASLCIKNFFVQPQGSGIHARKQQPCLEWLWDGLESSQNKTYCVHSKSPMILLPTSLAQVLITFLPILETTRRNL